MKSPAFAMLSGSLILFSFAISGCVSESESYIPTYAEQTSSCPVYKHSFLMMDYGCDTDFIRLREPKKLLIPEPYEPEAYAQCVAERAKADFDCKDPMEADRDITENMKAQLIKLAKPTFAKLEASIRKTPQYRVHSHTLALAQFPSEFDKKAQDIMADAATQSLKRSRQAINNIQTQIDSINSIPRPQIYAPINIIQQPTINSSPEYYRAPPVRMPINTNCQKLGNMLNCTTY